VKDGEEWYFTVRKFSGPLPAYTLPVNYEGFAEGRLDDFARHALFMHAAILSMIVFQLKSLCKYIRVSRCEGPKMSACAILLSTNAVYCHELHAWDGCVVCRREGWR
jgi:hypothetical protein